jgi:hypothetical protein
MFDKAGITLQDKHNKVFVAGHKGPHPQEYHETVFDRLDQATKDKEGEAYKGALIAELDKLAEEIATPGTELNKLITKTE